MATTDLVKLYGDFDVAKLQLRLNELRVKLTPECQLSGLKAYGCAHCNGVEPDFNLAEVLP